MTKKDYFSFCMAAFKVSPDYPFEGDFESAVLRHKDSGKMVCSGYECLAQKVRLKQ